jgi:cell wall-associated NlpC family hydrolase
MKNIVCHLAYVPLRKEPDHRSEQVSQLLFGETALIVDSRQEWLRIKSDFDHYEGWIEKASVSEADKAFISSVKRIVNEPLVHIISENSSILVPAGAEIPDPDSDGKFIFTKRTWQIQHFDPFALSHKKEDITRTALLFLNVPYLWGGRTIFGTDCSGFTQTVFKMHGIKLPRDARDQEKTGSPVGALKDAKPGDQLFFRNEQGLISHTGILLRDHEIIHASKYVRIDKLDDTGIYNREMRSYTHRLNSIRRQTD